jgi:hypothetical protein
MKTKRISYRVSQFWQAVRRRPSSRNLALAQNLLTPAQMVLFTRMQPDEQAHSLNVARSLIERGESETDLLKAALLHDVGKVCQPLKPWERAWIVLGKAIFPGLVCKWGAAPRNGKAVSFLQRPFVVADQHAAWGARLALQAGVSDLSANLIRRHQSRSDESKTLPGFLSAEDRLLNITISR